MSGKYLLDTNAVIALFNGESQVIERINQAQELIVSSIVVGELYYGAFNSQRQSENLARVSAFLSEVLVLSIDQNTARFYGQIKRELKSKGKPIPENDIWIAAIAIQHELALLSKDSHFDAVENLETVSW